MQYEISFCIPQYNNSDAAYRLVVQLLKNADERFQVVISDNASTDDTVERLKEINDSRLKICVNPINLGAKQNWCRALECGDGEWLYLVMGRDKLDVNKIGRLIDMLSHCCANHVGCAADRQTPGGIRIMDIYESAEYFLRSGEHPTGAIFRREAFLSLRDRKKYFQLSFAYPEIYIKRDILCGGYRGAVISAHVFTDKVNIDKSKVKSAFEQNKKIQYWYPQRQTEQFLHIIKMIEWDRRFEFSRKQNDMLYLRNWGRLMDMVSISWKKHNEDSVWTAHYGLNCRKVTKWEMLGNIVSAYRAVISFHKQHHRKMGLQRHSQMLCATCWKMIRISIKKIA